MKGSKIFAQDLTLFNDGLPPPPPDGSPDRRPGRDPELIRQRNEHLLYRYHYYLAYCDGRWEKVLPMLIREFYLSGDTISEIIADNAAKRREIMKENPSLEKLRERYPTMVWKVIKMGF